MIFKPELVEKILAGRKSVTRRPYTDAPCKYVAGRHYAVQPGRGKAAVGRICVESVELVALGNIDNRDARKEGFNDTGEFMDYWRALYHGQFFRKQLVWRIAFHLIDPVEAR